MTKQPSGPTPVRNLRSPGEIWDVALANAAAEGRTLSEVINSYLRRYNAAAAGRRGGGPRPDEPAPPAAAPLATAAAPDEPSAPLAPRRDPDDVPGHGERIELLQAEVPEQARMEFRRFVRDAHSATQPRYAPPVPLSPEELSLRIYKMAVAAGLL